MDDKTRRIDGRLSTLEGTVNDPKAGIKAIHSEIDDPKTGITVKVGSLDRTVNDATAGLVQKVEALDKKLMDSESRLGVTRRDLDRFWVLLAAVLVFIMQAGFLCLEVGIGRREHEAHTGVMNLMNWLVLCIVFYCVGFGFMFGEGNGLIGTHLFFLPQRTLKKHTHL